MQQNSAAPYKQPMILPSTPVTMQLLKQLGARQTVTLASGQGSQQTVSLQMLSSQSQPSALLSTAPVPKEKVRWGSLSGRLCMWGGGYNI